MVLDSQTARKAGGIGSSRGGYGYGGRRRRRTRRIIGVALLVGIVGYFAYGWISAGPSRGSSAAAPTVGDEPAPTGNASAVAPPAGADSTKPPAVAVSRSGEPIPVKSAPPAPPPPAPDLISNAGAVPTSSVPPILTAPTPNVPTVSSAPPPSASAAPPAPPAEVIRSGGEVARQIQLGRELIAQKQLVKAREVLSAALRGEINARDAESVRQDLTTVNKTLVFSPAIEAGDPLSQAYVVQPGDSLARIAKGYKVPWQFLQIINNIANPKAIRLGARIKVINGPFRVVVTRHDFRLDVWAGDLYIRSFSVGLGEFDSTPSGEWVVRTHSKLENPPWINPRTGQRFEADDPKNPLGEYWIGIRGTDSETEKFSGYGIHGTIYPETIGQMASMGCVRLLADDIKLLYAMLEEDHSRVTILK